MTYNILFVCKYNRFRSRVAKAYFDKINKNRNIKTDSAGIFKGNSVNKKTIDIVKKFRLNISGKTKGISVSLLKKQNLIVIVADNVPPSLFERRYMKKLIVWKVPDAKEGDQKTIKETFKMLTKIDKLEKSLEKVK